MQELLMPAGSYSKLETAFHFGADAVYIGGKSLSLRAYANNFTNEEIVRGVALAHSLGKKVYVTANIFARNADLESAADFFRFLEAQQVDAVLISDVGMLSLCREVAPSLTIHLSTQANTTNARAVQFWKEMGVARVVLARELSLKEISDIHAAVPDMELEAFVHGAMCMSYSGRCLLSSYFAGRSANSGECIQPCRWSWRITENERHASKPLDVVEDERGTYFMNSRDLRLLPRLMELADAGVVSFKVEGRMKSEFYVATVANAYRRALDEYAKLGSIPSAASLCAELETVAHRSYTEAYFDGDNPNTVSLDEGQIAEQFVFTAVVEDYADGVARVEMRNRFRNGDTLRVLSPNASVNGLSFEVKEIFSYPDGDACDDAKLVQHRYTLPVPLKMQRGDLLVKAAVKR